MLGFESVDVHTWIALIALPASFPSSCRELLAVAAHSFRLQLVFAFVLFCTSSLANTSRKEHKGSENAGKDHDVLNVISFGLVVWCRRANRAGVNSIRYQQWGIELNDLAKSHSVAI